MNPMNLVDGNIEAIVASSSKENGVRPWFAIDFGASPTCKIYQIRVKGNDKFKLGNLNVRQGQFRMN